MFSLCIFDIFSKYIGVVPFKDKKRYYNYSGFSRKWGHLDEWGHKSSKIWIDKGSEIYNRSMKLDSNIEMCPTHIK